MQQPMPTQPQAPAMTATAGITTVHIQKVSPSTLPFPETLKIQKHALFFFLDAWLVPISGLVEMLVFLCKRDGRFSFLDFLVDFTSFV